jgi:hypothetical protein
MIDRLVQHAEIVAPAIPLEDRRIADRGHASGLCQGPRDSGGALLARDRGVRGTVDHAPGWPATPIASLQGTPSECSNDQK